jgi:hypothetical protein
VVIVALAISSQTQAETAANCITIVHSGSQDRPVGSMRMCPGERRKSHAIRILENDWAFELEAAVFKRIETYVKKQDTPRSIGPGMIPFGTFTVEYGAKFQRMKYIVPPSAICSFFGQLIGLVPEKDYEEFHHVIADLMSRLQCS